MRALAAATVAAAMPRASSAGSRVTPASSMPIPASLKSAASASYLSAVSGRPPRSPPCEPVTTIVPTWSAETAEAEFERPNRRRLGDQQKHRFERRRRLTPGRRRLRQNARGVAAGRTRPAAEGRGRAVRMGDHPARHHIGAVADPRRQVSDGGGRYAEPRKIFEPGDAGAVASDAGIVEDRRGNAELRREVGGIDAAMRAVDDDGTPRFGADPGDAVGSKDRRGLGGHGTVSAKRELAAIMPGSANPAQ